MADTAAAPATTDRRGGFGRGRGRRGDDKRRGKLK